MLIDITNQPERKEEKDDDFLCFEGLSFEEEVQCLDFNKKINQQALDVLENKLNALNIELTETRRRYKIYEKSTNAISKTLKD